MAVALFKPCDEVLAFLASLWMVGSLDWRMISFVGTFVRSDPFYLDNLETAKRPFSAMG
jgi:hypothetical protein